MPLDFVMTISLPPRGRGRGMKEEMTMKTIKNMVMKEKKT